MGCGLPFAIGSCIAEGGKPVYCISGDGGFQMNIQELETVHREKLPVKIFILNNRVLGKISETQHFSHGDRFAATAESGGYSVPNFQKIAEAYGIRASAVSSNEEAAAALDEMLTDDRPYLLECRVMPDYPSL